MRKYVLFSVVSMVIVILTGSFSFSQDYTIHRITDNTYNDQYPQINSNGTIVWVACPEASSYCHGAATEIFLFDGENTLRLTNNATEDSNPHLNDNDFVVWQHHDGIDFEIYMYDGSNIIQITDNESYTDIDPQINNSNDVVWRRYYTNHGCSQTDIFIYRDTQITEIQTFQECNTAPQINDIGQIVWSGYNCGMFGVACYIGDGRLMFFDGDNYVYLTSNETIPQSQKINNFGEITWFESHIGNYEIFIFYGSSVTRLTDNDFNDVRPQINDNGYVVWEGPTSYSGLTAGELNLFDGTSVVRLTDNDYSDEFPQIDNNNRIVWEGYRGDSTEILLYDGSSTTQITDDGADDKDPQINDSGLVVWTKYQSYQNWEIYLAVPDQELMVDVLTPANGEALQDGVNFTATTAGFSGSQELSFYLREPGGDYGVPIGYDDLEAIFNPATEHFEYSFNTTEIPDGFYIIYAVASDSDLNESISDIVPFSVRNWACVEILPEAKEYRPGRMMPIEFEIRVDVNVDPMKPFVYNSELLIQIYDSYQTLLQQSVFGEEKTDYRIDIDDETYITKFKTERTPETYRVDILRKDLLLKSFNFSTTK